MAEIDNGVFVIPPIDTNYNENNLQERLPSEQTPAQRNKNTGIEYTPIQNRYIQPISRSTFDEAADAQIRSAFDPKCGLHVPVDYMYQGKKHHLVVINNPKKLPLASGLFTAPVNWSFVLASVEALPPPLENHIKELAPIKDKNPQNYLIELGQKRSYGIRDLYFLAPPIKI